MQIFKAFAVYDKKAQAYIYPHYFPQIGQAIREFEDQVNNPQMAFNKHPEDFCLFHIGEFDNASGKLKGNDQPVLIQEAYSLKTKEQK